MIAQVFLKPVTIYSLLGLLPNLTALPEQRQSSIPQIYEEQPNDDELARELLAPLPGDLAQWRAIPEVEADEFETVYLWFLS